MNIRVLCAFQNPEFFDFVKASFSGLELELIKASSESLALFLTQKNFPCLLICEFDPSRAFALEILSNLKSERELEEIPVLLFARRPGEVCLPELILPQGAAGILWYPIESYEFLAAVKPFLQEMKDKREAESPE